jgi:mannose-6-phosphate isomerase-like protein (cupin superfamily)
MNPSVKKFDAGAEYFFIEGCHILEMSNSPDDPEVSIARARLEPGKTTAWHRLTDVSERYVILEGQGLAQVGDLPASEVAAGDVVLIPPGTPQRISNTGPVDLIFLAVCTPRFTGEAYQGKRM